MRASKAEETREAAVVPAPDSSLLNDGNSKKRKASDEDDSVRKRTKAIDGVPDGFFNATQEVPEIRPSLPSPTTEIQIPSRPATPSKPVLEVPKRANVDEDEWAAFEADIAATDVQIVNEDATISAPAMTAAEIVQKSLEETNAQKKERVEAEIEGDKEDAARKMEEELDEMESLEQRVRKMRERREELRQKESSAGLNRPQPPPFNPLTPDDDDDDEEDEEDDDWMGLR